MGNVGVVARRRDWRFLDVLVGDSDGTVPGEWRPRGQHLVEHDGQRVHIAARIRFQSLSLFGRQVRSRAHDRSGACQVVGLAAERSCDAEVGHLDLAGLGDHDVAGLDVAVHHAVAVSECERSGNVDGDICSPVGVQRAVAADHLREASALHVLHHDVVGAFVVAPVVHADHVRLAQVRGGLSLTPEPLDE